MKILADILTALVALEHLYILWMEMFAWETAGKKAFGKALPDELYGATKGLAANQGLYNGFFGGRDNLVIFITTDEWSFYVRVFFLSCVIVAGVYGALTASKKIFFVQALPAVLALLATLLI